MPELNNLIMRLFAVVFLMSAGVVLAAPPVNANATRETRSLLSYLNNTQKPILLGGAYGGGKKSYGWIEQFKASRRFPVLFALEYYDVGPIELRPDARDEARQLMIQHFASGGVLSVHDHVYNFAAKPPIDLTNAYRNRTVDGLIAILPGGSAHAEYRAYLDRQAAFFKSISFDGVAAPILYRPFHEMDGNWFWWGGEESAAKLVAVWRFTVDYLIYTKSCNNLLVVWSPNISSKASVDYYGKFWPGAEYVDVVGVDGYDNTENADFANSTMQKSYSALLSIAKSNKKPIAWTEIGFEKAGRSKSGFWTDNVLKAGAQKYPDARYYLIWNHIWGPAPGNDATDSFKKLTDEPGVMTLDKSNEQELYGR